MYVIQTSEVCGLEYGKELPSRQPGSSATAIQPILWLQLRPIGLYFRRVDCPESPDTPDRAGVASLVVSTGLIVGLPNTMQETSSPNLFRPHRPELPQDWD